MKYYLFVSNRLLNPDVLLILLVNLPPSIETLFIVGVRSKPHVRTNLYTTRNTKKLTTTKTIAVIIFANVFKPDSCGFNGRVELCSAERLRFVAKPRANAGNANDCVNVNLCNDSLNEYGPTDPRAAARNNAYSKSKASNNEYRVVIVDERRRPSFCRSGCNHGSDDLKLYLFIIQTLYNYIIVL